MIITFCGHSDFRPTATLEETLLSILETQVGNAQADFYLGGYGNFDIFALRVGRLYQKTHPNVTLVLSHLTYMMLVCLKKPKPTTPCCTRPLKMFRLNSPFLAEQIYGRTGRVGHWLYHPQSRRRLPNL